MVLCTPDLSQESARRRLRRSPPRTPSSAISTRSRGSVAGAAPIERRGSESTEWILLTSGTTGQPKLVAHTLASLAGTLPRPTAGRSAAAPTVWSTFYDIRRYGGLQIYLRAVLSGAPLVLSSADESTRDFLSARRRAPG